VNWWPSRAARLNETHTNPFNKRQNSPSGFVNWEISTDWELISGINENYQEFASEIRPLTLFKLMRSSPTSGFAITNASHHDGRYADSEKRIL
jgi:hypothetical protein